MNSSAISETTYWKCNACKKVFKSMEQLDQHKKSKNHKKNEKLFISQNDSKTIEYLKSSMFESIAVDKNATGKDQESDGDDEKEENQNILKNMD
mmetsp:Transcript_35832/g.34866  ORF Transcript_35832/g.34866 Transcript_35832/m.34866 type:complete len:94 (-) Transcript_35832:1095-1376(-)